MTLIDTPLAPRTTRSELFAFVLLGVIALAATMPIGLVVPDGPRQFASATCDGPGGVDTGAFCTASRGHRAGGSSADFLMAAMFRP